jgi:hypothetical protein
MASLEARKLIEDSSTKPCIQIKFEGNVWYVPVYELVDRTRLVHSTAANVYLRYAGVQRSLGEFIFLRTILSSCKYTISGRPTQGK